MPRRVIVRRVVLFVILILSFTATFGTQAVDQEIIPPARITDWTLAGIPGGIPDPAVTKNVKTDYGAQGNGIADDTAAFKNAIAGTPAGGVLSIPAGTYRINDELRITKSIVLRGEGPDQTRLVFKLQEEYESAIRVNSAKSDRAEIAVTSGFQAGSTQLTLAKTSGIVVGSYIDLRQDNIPSLMYTNSGWNQSWAQRVMGQIFRVTAINGKTVTLNEPIRMNVYKAQWKPTVRRIDPIKNFGVENLYMTLLTHNNHITMRIRDCIQCWIQNIESEYTDRLHISLERSYQVEIRNNYFHHSHDYGGDGHGYGVVLSDRTSNSLVEDNIFYHLRHAMMVKAGATGNVFGYNFSVGPVESSTGQLYPTADISLHGHYPNYNLFEGNIVEDIRSGDYWGPSGPGNTFFRNVATVNRNDYGVQLLDKSNKQNVVGNVIANKLDIDGSVKNTIAHGNRISGTMRWDGDIASHVLPVSFYHTAKPAFYGDLAWPSIDPVTNIGTNPAYERYLTTYDKNMLANGSFEAVGGSSKQAAYWKISGKQSGKSFKVCNSGADTGSCAFQFKGGADVNAKLTQWVWVPHAGTGASLTLSGRVKADNWQGEGRIKASILYLDGSKASANIVIDAGTYAYKTMSFTKPLKVGAIVKKITVEISVKGGTGTQSFTVDNARVVMNAGGALNTGLVSAPDAPTSIDLRGQ